MNFKHFYLLLVLSGTFIVKFTANISNGHAQDYSCPEGNFCFLFTWRKVTSARWVTRCCTTGNPPLEVAPGQQKTRVNSYRSQTVHQGKVDPRVSELPRSKASTLIEFHIFSYFNEIIKMNISNTSV